jgi:hypothetical protein
VPTLPSLLSLPEELAGVTESVAMDVGESLNPMRGLRKAKQNGHQVAFSEDKFLGVLSAGAVTARCLETTEKAFQIMIGARPARMFSVRKQLGRQGHGDLLYSGPYVP